MQILLEESLEKNKTCKLCSKEIQQLSKFCCCNTFCHLACKTKYKKAMCPKCEILKEFEPIEFEIGQYEKKLKQENLQKKNASKCPICEKTAEPIIMTNCNHCFHVKCFKIYLSKKCPICDQRKPYMVDKSCQTIPLEPLKGAKSSSPEKIIEKLVQYLPNQICGIPLQQQNTETKNIKKKN